MLKKASIATIMDFELVAISFTTNNT